MNFPSFPCLTRVKIMTYVIDKVDWYKAVAEEFPSSPAFAELAELLYEDAKYEELVDVCLKGLQQDPHNLKGKLFLALGLLKLGQQEDSERLLHEIKEKIGYLSKLFAALAEIENLKDNKESATALIKTAYALNPEDDEVLEKALSWNIKNIEVIDTVARIRYEKHIEPELQYKRPFRPEYEVTQITEPEPQQEETIQKPVTQNVLARFTKFAIDSIDRKLHEISQPEHEVPLSNIFDDKISDLIREYITSVLKETRH